MREIVQAARRRMQDGAYTCVVMCGEWEYVSRERGVKPLLSLLESKDYPVGAVAADKTVGAGAAYLYVLLGVRMLWANVISESALRILERYGVNVAYGERVSYIINRQADGICPIEAAVADANTPSEAYRLIVEALDRIKNR